jgi:2-succinyl-6-hydroxy-2,4-cyclohexadiene-1-carboxylate synthase
MWVLLHGFTGSPQSWSRVVQQAELDQTPLIPTLAGHGRDWQRRDVESFEGEVARLVSLISSVAPPRLLCAYSMGARVALGLLARQPSFFDSAVLIGAHPGLTEDSARAERREVDADRVRMLRERGLMAFIDLWEKLPLFATQRDLSPDVLNYQRRIRLGQDAEGLARALEVLGLAEMPDYEPAIASAGIPITFMAGSRDSKFFEIANALATHNDHVDAEVVDGVGHNVVLEAPEAVAATLKRVEERARR